MGNRKINMATYIIKWIAASLIMPVMVLLFGKALNNVIVLALWPGSIVLMSLGTEDKPLNEILYVWSIAVGLNLLLYTIIGTMIYFFLKLIKVA